jgi:pyruvyltransferase
VSKLKVYAWTKPGITNFGDEMGPDILRRLGHTVTRVPVHQAEVVTIGSVMHHLAAAPQGCVVAGAGIMHAHNVGLDVSHLDVRLVRGELTHAAMDWPRDSILPWVGDPAILAADIYAGPGIYKSTQRKYKIGWVPHYMDMRLITSANVVISPLDTPENVVSQISQCEYILTSSLHALIVAQSFGIPAQRLAHPRVLGGDTKWIDYATGYAHADKESIYGILKGL